MHCHATTEPGVLTHKSCIALVGHPNVGKSVIFQRLTGQHVTVANYPGTTVEVVRGAARSMPGTIIVDTPGVVTFPPHTEDEQVTERVLLDGSLKAILQVGDAKNLRRTLLLTVGLAEMGLPLVLSLNMTDEADARGVLINYDSLADGLNIPVIPTTATRGLGLDEVTNSLQSASSPDLHLEYPAEIEVALKDVCDNIPDAPISPRAVALLWLSGDPVVESWLSSQVDEPTLQALYNRRSTLTGSYDQPLATVIQVTRLEQVDRLVSSAIIATGAGWYGLSAKLGRLATHPLWGLIILALVLYGLYWFVGIFGAGILVDALEGHLFGEAINPWVVDTVQTLVPIPIIVDFLVGEFGLWTMGMTYALALIFPIVTTFFLAFGVLEDSGYLPRLAVLSNRTFRTLGLNGKAVLPMILGLGCVTMATLTTRILESKRERVLATMLLALAIPCSAQLGIVLGLLAGISLTATLIWGGVVLIVMLSIGWLAARLVPGERTELLVELPPLRWPVFSNVLIKTLARLEWYLKEVIPLFLIGTAIMFALNYTGILSSLIKAGEPLVTGWLGLPPETSAAFLMGFLRRDFGATGLFVMESQGMLSPAQAVVAMVTITLFVPCIASVLVIAKERGWRTATGILVFIIPLAFLIGGILYRLLAWIGWGS
jgi:ferrous iron transport protein B